MILASFDFHNTAWYSCFRKNILIFGGNRMKKTLIAVFASVLLVAVGIVVGMSLNRPTDVPDTPVGSPEAPVDTLSSETQNADNTETLKVQDISESTQSQTQEIIDTSNAQDLPHDKLLQYFEWTYYDLGYTFGYDNLAKPEMIEEQYNALETRFKDFFDISEYKLPDNYKSEYNKFLSETLQVFGVTVDLETEKPASKDSDQKTNNTTTQKPAEQKPAEQKPAESKPTAPKQTEQKPSDTSNSGNKSYIEELREMYPGVSDEDLISLFGDGGRITYNNPSAQSGFFGG